jgi:beta-glucosidase
VQLYLQDVSASVVRPVKELKDFQKVMLQPGESRELTFVIREEQLKFFNAQLKYGAETGEFKVQLGLDSQDVKTASFELTD